MGCGERHRLAWGGHRPVGFKVWTNRASDRKRDGDRRSRIIPSKSAVVRLLRVSTPVLLLSYAQHTHPARRDGCVQHQHQQRAERAAQRPIMSPCLCPSSYTAPHSPQTQAASHTHPLHQHLQSHDVSPVPARFRTTLTVLPLHLVHIEPQRVSIQSYRCSIRLSYMQ